MIPYVQVPVNLHPRRTLLRHAESQHNIALRDAHNDNDVNDDDDDMPELEHVPAAVDQRADDNADMVAVPFAQLVNGGFPRHAQLDESAQRRIVARVLEGARPGEDYDFASSAFLRGARPLMQPDWKREVAAANDDAPDYTDQDHVDHDDACPVCYERPAKAVLQPCAHALCRTCLTQPSVTQCPLCRGAIAHVDLTWFIMNVMD
jgi:hypothetical protein